MNKMKDNQREREREIERESVCWKEMEWIDTKTRHSDLYRFVGVFIIMAIKEYLASRIFILLFTSVVSLRRLKFCG